MGNSAIFKEKLALLHRYTVVAIVCWIFIIAASLIWNIHEEHKSIESMAINEAHSSFKRDEAFRLFIASRGGVYVPLDAKTPSNPYLHHPERDITTTSGKKFTLMNGAYFFDKVMKEFGQVTDVKWRLTSLKPTNPANTPDEWEEKALRTFEQQAKMMYGFYDIKGEPYLRLLSPLVTVESCLKCHAYQGYKIGEIRGAMGVLLPMTPYLAQQRRVTKNLIWTHGILALLGLFGIGFASMKIRNRFLENIRAEEELEKHRDHLEELVKEQTREITEANLRLTEENAERKRAEEALQLFKTIVESSGEAIAISNPVGELVYINPAHEKLFGRSLEQVRCMNYRDYYPAESVEVLNRIVAPMMERGESWEGELDVFDSAGRQFPLWERSGTVWDADGKMLYGFGFMHDITERKRAELAREQILKELSQRKKELELLLNSATSVLEEADFTSSARRIFDGARQMTGAQSGYVALLSANGKENEVLFLESGGLPCTVDPNLPMPIRGLRGEAYKMGSTVLDNDFMNSQWAAFMPADHVDLKNVMFVPLNIEGKTVGLMGLANKSGDFTDDDRRMAETFGQLAVIALQKSRSMETLRENEAKTQAILDNSPIAIWCFDGEKYSYLSKEWYRYTGQDLNLPLTIDRWTQLVHPDDLEKSGQIWVEHWKNKTAHYNDFRLRGAKGEYRQIHCLAVPIFDEEGNFQHFQGFNIDVTEREQVVEALRESEERYRTLFDGVPIGLYRTSPDGRIMDANLALVQMLGYPDRESLQATNAVNTYVNAEGRQSWQALIKQEGMLSNFEKQLRRYDGSNIFLEENARAVYDPEGRVLFYEGSFQDITERKQAEEALRRNEEKMRLILDATTDGIWKWNFMTNELNFSPRYYTMLGYEPDEFPSNFESWQNLIHPDDLQSALGVAEEYLKTKPDKYENEFRLKTKHGGYRWIRARARVVERSQDGNALLMIGNHEDITERKQAEEEKRRLEERSRKVVEDIFRFIPEGVLVFSRKMELLRQNQAFRELVSGYARRLGFAEDELGNLIIDKIKAGLRDNNIDEFVKSRKGLMIVIPAKAGSGSGTGAGIQ